MPTQEENQQEVALQRAIDAINWSVDSLVIRTDLDLQQANDLLVSIARQRKKNQETMKRVTGYSGLKQSLEHAQEQISAVVAPLDRLRERLQVKMSAYLDARKEAERKQNKSALESYAKQQASFQAKAEALRQKGETEAAQALSAVADALPVPYQQSGKVELEGTAQVEDYEVEVTDLKAFAQGLALGTIPLTGIVLQKEMPIIEVRESVVKHYAREARKAGRDLDFPGIKVTVKNTFRVKTR